MEEYLKLREKLGFLQAESEGIFMQMTALVVIYEDNKSCGSKEELLETKRKIEALEKKHEVTTLKMKEVFSQLEKIKDSLKKFNEAAEPLLKALNPDEKSVEELFESQIDYIKTLKKENDMNIVSEATLPSEDSKSNYLQQIEKVFLLGEGRN